MSASSGLDPSFNPRTGEQWDAVAHSTPAEVVDVLGRATRAATLIAASSPSVRQGWLGAVSTALLAHQEELAVIADEETGLGLPRLTGEIAGAARSIDFYADVAVEGSFVAASSDTVSDVLRIARWNTPVGPVAVFGASNFPFGFGVFGHDVASALAAGCSVVAKAHPAHPRLSVRIASIARQALASAGAPDGAYDIVVGFDAGVALVDSPAIKAIAFTGSQRGGMAILARGAQRGVPVFAEMGTVNPVLVTSGATRAADGSPDLEAVTAIAAGFVNSFTLGTGQFCTKPGLLFAPAGSGMLVEVQRLVAAIEPAPLLTAGIAAQFAAGVKELVAAATPSPTSGRSPHSAPVNRAGSANSPDSTGPAATLPGYLARAQAIPVLLSDLVADSRLLEECFGPVALVCEYDDFSAALDTIASLQGSLVASVFTAGDNDAEAHSAVSRLLPHVGRVAVNAWPTGVANTWSSQHGGPWPATSRPEATSVGAGALTRFVRPVALQNGAPDMLPPELADDNPWQLPRRTNGTVATPTIS